MGLSHTVEQRGSELGYVEPRDGHHEPADLDGLPPTAMPARRMRAGNGYFALDTGGRALYQSADGRHWTGFPLVSG
nr:hypothetical protein GCM10020063_023130 [Dactylosporangium thailandense]